MSGPSDIEDPRALSDLLRSFTLSTLGDHDRRPRSHAFASLASLIASNDSPSDVAGLETNINEVIVNDWLAGTSAQEHIHAFYALSAIFQLSPELGLRLGSKQGFAEKVGESVDLFSGSRGSKSGSGLHDAEAIKVRLALTDFLSHAAGHRNARSFVQKQAGAWLRTIALDDDGQEVMVRVNASLAVIKLSLFASSKKEGAAVGSTGVEDLEGLSVGEEQAGQGMSEKEVEIAVKLFRDTFVETIEDSQKAPSFEVLSRLPTLLEGISFLTLLPHARQLLCDDPTSSPPLLQSIFSVLARKSASSSQLDGLDAAVGYSVVTVLENLTKFPRRDVDPTGTDDGSDLAKRLRKFALSRQKGGKGDSSNPPEKGRDEEGEDDQTILKRHLHLLQPIPSSPNVGIVPTLNVLSASQSQGVRRKVGRILLLLIEGLGKEDRGRVIQQGGAKSLLNIISLATTPQTATSTPSKPDESSPVEEADLPAFQALAKLLITTNPLLVLSPTHILSSLSILTKHLLLHRSSSKLMKFEALMALTNLSSLGGDAEMAERIIKAGDVSGGKEGRVLEKVEELMLDDNFLVRRAATELVCNLVQSPLCSRRYQPPASRSKAIIAAEEASDGTDEESKPVRLPADAQRTHILIALSDSPDLQTRLAASGALAILTDPDPESDQASGVCGTILEHVRWVETLRDLVDPASDGSSGGDPNARSDEGLRHRGIVCLRNLVAFAQQSDGKELDILKEAGVRTALEKCVSGAEVGEAVHEIGKEALGLWSSSP